MTILKKRFYLLILGLYTTSSHYMRPDISSTLTQITHSIACIGLLSTAYIGAITIKEGYLNKRENKEYYGFIVLLSSLYGCGYILKKNFFERSTSLSNQT